MIIRSLNQIIGDIGDTKQQPFKVYCFFSYPILTHPPLIKGGDHSSGALLPLVLSLGARGIHILFVECTNKWP